MKSGNTPSLLKNWVAFWPFLALWAVFLWPQLILRSSFIFSDYYAQHLPWAQVNFTAIRAGHLPLWTPLMGGGFPIFAEGQIAALYWPHLIAYRLLPFMAAYTWSVPAHLLIGGAGLFVYCRRIGMSAAAAGLAAACFGFGSAYGGCFYNTGSLRTLSWLPWMLWVFERSRNGDGRAQMRAMLAGAALAAMQWTAGFSQMAVYAFGYVLCHEILAGGVLTRHAKWGAFRPAATCLAAVLLGTAMAWIQVAPAMELIRYSIRQSENAAFALWGSVPPVGLIGLLYPEWGNVLRLSFYIGVPAIFWLLVLYWTRPLAVETRRHLWLAVFFLLLAFGRHNPLYAWAVETLRLTMLRNPSKFLFFAAMSMAIAAGFGLDRCLESWGKNSGRRIEKFGCIFAGIVAVLPLAAQGIVAIAGPFWEKYSRWYVDGLIREKGSSAKSADVYSRQMTDFFSGLEHVVSYQNPHIWQTIGAVSATVLLLMLFIRKKINRSLFLTLSLVVVVLDLWSFGIFYGTGFIGNVRPVSTLISDTRVARLTERILADPGPMAELVASPAEELLSANTGMYYGIAHIGGYSPLLIKKYYDLVYDLGVSDGSLGRPITDPGLWKRRRRLLNLIGLRYLRTDRPLHWDGMKLMEEAEGMYVYENLAASPEIWGVYQSRVLSDEKERIRAVQESPEDPLQTVIVGAEVPGAKSSGPQEVVRGVRVSSPLGADEFDLSMARSGIAVTRVSAYPGWRVWVDGRETTWFDVNHAFIGFALDAGRHRIRMEFKPTHWWLWCGVSAAALLVWLLGAWLVMRKNP